MLTTPLRAPQSLRACVALASRFALIMEAERSFNEASTVPTSMHIRNRCRPAGGIGRLGGGEERGWGGGAVHGVKARVDKSRPACTPATGPSVSCN